MSVPAATQSPPAQGADANDPGRTGATNAQEVRADPTQVSSGAETDQTTRGPDYFRQAFQRIRGYTQATSPATPAGDGSPATASGQPPAAPTGESSALPESERSAAQPAAAPPAGPATTLPPQRPQQAAPAVQDGRVVLSQQEFQRQVQAEADRILAKRQKDEAEKAAREQEVELRRTNPFEYARLMEQKEQELQAAQVETQRLTSVVNEQLFHYDRNVLDIFVGALPDADRPKVIAKDVQGIPGRKATAEATLKALRTRWLAEGRASAKADLMKDQTFIKEILARYGQVAPESSSAPVQVRPSTVSSADQGNASMNDWMRSSARGIRTGVLQ